MKKILTHSIILAVALAIASCSATPVRRSMKEGWNDTLTAEKIRYKLMRDDQVKKSAMHVQVFRGQVTLTGRAMTDAEKNRAETLAKSVKRVTGVENYIHVVGGAAAPATSVAVIQEKTIAPEKVPLTEDEMPAKVPTIRVGTGTGKTATPAVAQTTKSVKPDAKLGTVQKSATPATKVATKPPAKKEAPVAAKVIKPAPQAVAVVPAEVPATKMVVTPHKETVPMSTVKVVGQSKTGLPWDGEVYEDDASSVTAKPAPASVATRAPVPAQPQSASSAPAAVMGSDDLAKEAAQELEKLRQKK